MKNIKNFDSFTNSKTEVFYNSIKDLISEEEISNILNNKWKYDSFYSIQADSELPASYSTNSDYICVVQYDDYDDSQWTVAILKKDDGGDEEILSCDNLNFIEAWSLYEKIVGKKNAIISDKYSGTKKSNGIYFKDTEIFKDWLKQNPVYGSKKLKNLRKTGIFENN